MTSTNNNIFNNTDGSASNSSSCFDKNEFYSENGLIQSQKKDRKSHGKIAANQTECRNKKITAQISLLPKKLQAKLSDVAIASSPPGKSKNINIAKLFHNRSHVGQSAIQGLLCQEYDEQLLAEEDALEEALEEALKEKQEKFNKEEAENEEVRYQEYLAKKMLWDFPNDGMSSFEFMCLRNDIEAYEAEMNTKTLTLSDDDDDEQIGEVIYKDHKYELEHCRSDWGAKKLQWFQKEVDNYERDHDINQPSEALDLWLRYGLTKEQYDANLIYNNNCAKLAAYYQDPDYASHPQYGIDLEAEIKKFELDFDTKTQKDAEDEDKNDWWMTNCDEGKYDIEYLNIHEKWREIQHERENESMLQETIASFERECETYEDWCETKREQDMEDFRQNAIDDRDDY